MALRFRGLGRRAIIEIAESLASDQTLMAIAGNVSQKMLAHYSYVQGEAKRRAVDVPSEG